jgi:hypothetical protein
MVHARCASGAPFALDVVTPTFGVEHSCQRTLNRLSPPTSLKPDGVPQPTLCYCQSTIQHLDKCATWCSAHAAPSSRRESARLADACRREKGSVRLRRGALHLLVQVHCTDGGGVAPLPQREYAVLYLCTEYVHPEAYRGIQRHMHAPPKSYPFLHPLWPVVPSVPLLLFFTRPVAHPPAIPSPSLALEESELTLVRRQNCCHMHRQVLLTLSQQ